ncbi:MAG: helix-turn-helix transcriptional regulator [Clostridia bacterium]|nr:helix-turn-helix transcriptional regulator [Clostridia bacterium]
MRYEYSLQEPSFTVENISIVNVSRGTSYRHSNAGGRLKHAFIYIVNGKLRHTFLDSTTDILYGNTGELIFIPRGVSYYSTYLEENTEIKVVQFDLAKGELPAYLSAPQKIELPNAGEHVDAFFLPSENHTNAHPFYYRSCLYRLLWQIDDSYSKLPTKYKRLQPALTALSQGYAQNRKIAYYAELCGMSEVGFRRLFHGYTGLSPVDYRNDLRLANARVKLQSGEYNVSEAAETSGFSNLSFFIRLYKKKYGCTPKKE